MGQAGRLVRWIMNFKRRLGIICRCSFSPGRSTRVIRTFGLIQLGWLRKWKNSLAQSWWYPFGLVSRICPKTIRSFKKRAFSWPLAMAQALRTVSMAFIRGSSIQQTLAQGSFYVMPPLFISSVSAWNSFTGKRLNDSYYSKGIHNFWIDQADGGTLGESFENSQYFSVLWRLWPYGELTWC